MKIGVFVPILIFFVLGVSKICSAYIPYGTNNSHVAGMVRATGGILGIAALLEVLYSAVRWIVRLHTEDRAFHVSPFALTTGICCVIVFASPAGLPSGSHNRAFDAEEWKRFSSVEDTYRFPSPRQEMLGDLVGRLKSGKTRVEIESLLGASLNSAYFKATSRDLLYYLGPERDHVFNIDSEWLLIWFDGQGRFERYEIRND